MINKAANNKAENKVELTMKTKLILLAVLFFLHACAELKDTGETIGEGAKDVATSIGHASRDAAKSIGKNTKKVVEDIKDDEED